MSAWPISTNPSSKEAGELCPTRGTCFVARCLEFSLVAALRWFGGVFETAYVCLFLFHSFFRSNANGLRHVSGSLPSSASLLVVA